MKNNGKIIEPYGGKLVNLVVKDSERDEWLDKANQYPSHQLSGNTLSYQFGYKFGFLDLDYI